MNNTIKSITTWGIELTPERVSNLKFYLNKWFSIFLDKYSKNNNVIIDKSKYYIDFNQRNDNAVIFIIKGFKDNKTYKNIMTWKNYKSINSKQGLEFFGESNNNILINENKKRITKEKLNYINDNLHEFFIETFLDKLENSCTSIFNFHKKEFSSKEFS